MAPHTKKQKREEVQLLEFRPWAELPPEILGLIFQTLRLEDRLVKLPRVCKSWSSALKGPYCWKEIDIYEWSLERKQTKRAHRIDRLLRTLIKRSGDSFQKLCVHALCSEDIFSLIADNAKNLQTLKLNFCGISDATLEKLASKLPSLTSLDVSHCKNIGTHGLEAIGNNCKNLTNLCYYVSPNTFTDQKSRDLAHSVSATMPKLKSLDISYFQVGTKSVVEIITNCKELESLNITGCYAVDLDGKFLDSFPGLKVTGPGRYYEEDDWGNYCDCCGLSSDDSDDPAYNALLVADYYSLL